MTVSSQNWFSLHENSSSNGCPKNATFRIIILQAYTLEKPDLRCLESDLSGQNGEHCEIWSESL